MAVVEEILIGSKADTRGFKKAETAAAKLTKTVKTLAGTLGLAYGTAALVSFGKAAVKAFAADEAAALRLSNAVDNLGISFANPAIAKFISELETTAGVADDVLRPAFQGLLTTTGSLTQSQKLLNDAITISRASGVDLATVSQDLANGYVGITRGLKKYNTGLTQAELSSKSFSDILGILLKQSAGAANAYLATTSFKFDVLTVAADNAREVIGEGLVDALARAGGGAEAKDAVKTINAIAKGINAITLATGTAVGGLTSVLSLLGRLPKDIFQGFVASQGGINMRQPVVPKTATTSMTAQQKALMKLEKDAAARNKKLMEAQTKASKALTAEQKKQAALKKAGTIFDLDQIQLIAALKGKLSDEDRKRVELQFALITGNTKEAQLLTYELAKALGLGEKIAKDLASLPDAKNPFASWEAYLDMLMAKAQKVAMVTPAFGTTGALGNPNFETGTTAQIVSELDKSTAYILQLAKETDALVASIAGSSAANPQALKNLPSPTGYGTNFRRAEEASNMSGPIQVTVQIDGKAIASSLQNSSLSGIGSTVNRTGG
jgi:hypothetical protein